jgi:iron-sulfur cluster assembly accessory protein
MTTPIQTNTLQITPTAAQMVRELLSPYDLTQGYALRIYIAGKSCSGFQYGMAIDKNTRGEDSIIEVDGIKILVDEISIQSMLGTKIDYIDDERGKGFLMDNPNALPECGCGGGNCECGEN